MRTIYQCSEIDCENLATCNNGFYCHKHKKVDRSMRKETTRKIKSSIEEIISQETFSHQATIDIENEVDGRVYHFLLFMEGEKSESC